MNPTQQTLDLMKTALSMKNDEIAKSVSTATGLVAYDLQAPAKNLFPVNTPIRNRLPRVGGGIGTATNWKMIQALTGSGWDGSGWVAEGQRSGRMSYSAVDKAAPYATIGEEDSVTFESISAGRTFEDVRATGTLRVLQKAMLKEEMALLFGNRNLALGTAGVPTTSASGSSATLPAATYSVIVVLLTGEGFRNSSLSAGVALNKTITGADGQTYVVNGGASNKSAAASQAITLGQTLTCTATYKPGTVAYAWFVGVSGSEKLEAITTTNVATFSAPLIGGSQQAATAVTTDRSSNSSMAFDGLATTAMTSGSGAYVKTLSTGATLTASGRGTISEIDVMLASMWDAYQVSPTVFYVNSQELRNITNKALTGPSSAPLLQVFANPDEGYGNLMAGGVVGWYFNPFTMGGGMKIPILIHPMVPPGMIIGWCENLPLQYQNNNVPNVAEVKVRQEYYQIDWPLKTRAQEFGVYAEETLAVYAPFAMGIINNISDG